MTHHHTHTSPAPHDHSAPGHHHGPPPDAPFTAAFGIGIALNLAFVALETAGGIWADSTALLSDASHNLSDVLSLALAWGAGALARRAARGRYTYGFKGLTIQAALLNAVLLYAALGVILWEAVAHLRHPEPVNGRLVMGLAAAGIGINGFTAWLFRRGRQGSDVNVRGAYLHLLTDALVSAGVVVGGAIVTFTAWTWVDPLISLGILGVVAIGGWGVLRETLYLSVQAVPAGVALAEVRAWLLTLPGVTALHDLHVWPLGTTETALTVHLVRSTPADNLFLDTLRRELRTRFGIGHATVQVEAPDAITDEPDVC